MTSGTCTQVLSLERVLSVECGERPRQRIRSSSYVFWVGGTQKMRGEGGGGGRPLLLLQQLLELAPPAGPLAVM